MCVCVRVLRSPTWLLKHGRGRVKGQIKKVEERGRGRKKIPSSVCPSIHQLSQRKKGRRDRNIPDRRRRSRSRWWCGRKKAEARREASEGPRSACVCVCFLSDTHEIYACMLSSSSIRWLLKIQQMKHVCFGGTSALEKKQKSISLSMKYNRVNTP